MKMDTKEIETLTLVEASLAQDRPFGDWRYIDERTSIHYERRIEMLAKFDITWVEEPVPAEDLAGHARIRAGSSIPIQTGENWWFGHDMAHAFAAGACDFCMPDLMKIGGISCY